VSSLESRLLKKDFPGKIKLDRTRALIKTLPEYHLSVQKTSLKQETASGIVWNFTELLLRRGVGGLITIVLAWFLSPEEFGLIAMMAVFLSLSNVLVDAGFSQSLIRSMNVTEREYSTAFYSNIILAFIVYGLLFIGAPFIADFYEQPDLVLLIRVTGLAIIFNSFAIVQRAVLSRELKFKLQLQVSFPAALVSGTVAILLAYAEFGVWALVVQILAQATLNTALYWRLKLWRPKLLFGWTEFKKLSAFGGYLMLNGITTVPIRHMYVIVIAKLFTAPIAGLYFFAEKIRDLMIQQLVSSIQAVTYPALARLKNQPEKLKNGYRQVIAVMTFLMFPVLIFLAVFIEIIFRLLVPEVWWSAAVYLQLMCIASLLYPLHATNLNILKIKDRADLVFYLGLFKKTVAIVIFFISYRFGVIGILLGQIISSVLAYLPNSYFSKQLIDYSIKEQLEDFMPSLLLAVSIGSCMYYLKSWLVWPEIIVFFVLGSVGVISYLMCAWLFKLPALEMVRSLMKQRMKGKSG